MIQDANSDVDVGRVMRLVYFLPPCLIYFAWQRWRGKKPMRLVWKDFLQTPQVR